MKERIAVAMSGGVDSAVAAALLQEQGFEVVGLTMCFGLSEAPGKKPRCCGLQGIEDARRVAHKLGIRHYVLNLQKPLEEFVIKDFCSEYAAGRTPNPCVRCNQYLKFGLLLKKALALGAKYLATGHYARIVRGQGYLLEKAKDKFKDQSYFLYRLRQAQLSRILFPLGSYTKEEVRGLARKFGLAVADKPGSQEICFFPGDDYRAFLKTRLKGRLKPGLIFDREGDVLGSHQGIAYYTIGQREGLGIALGYPAYITKIDPRANRIFLGVKDEVMAREFLLRGAHFIGRRPKKKVAAAVKIRYNHQQAPAEIFAGEDKTRVVFKVPQFAVTPGQSAVFYRGEVVLGGGVIERVFSAR